MLHATRAIPLGEIEQALELALGPGNAVLVGDASTPVLGVSEDSRRCETGCLFVGKTGAGQDGLSFWPDALKGGAVALLTDRGAEATFVPRLVVSDVKAALGHVAQLCVGRPSTVLSVVGITGTNGKTTTAALVARALAHAGHKVARLGTLGLYVGDAHVKDTLTTPGAEDLAECMRLALAQGVSHFVMEVSSHALAQERVAGVHFAVAAFSNLSQDHLDYHGSMADYGAAKAKLFESAPRASVINVADEFGRGLAARIDNCLRVSLDPAEPADIRTRALSLTRRGTSIELDVLGQDITLTSPLLGEFNAENLLLALGILVRLGLEPQLAATCLGKATAVAGRLERIDGPEDDVVALVDYAHTPDAVGRVIDMARNLAPTSVVCVLGCGGDRDRQKRPLMGQVAAAGADEVWITTDNPRSEDPAEIASQVLMGARAGSAHVAVELDRRRAIENAILAAPAGAMVLVLGKGHETYQIVGPLVLDFDDRVEVKSALRRRREGKP